MRYEIRQSNVSRSKIDQMPAGGHAIVSAERWLRAHGGVNCTENSNTEQLNCLFPVLQKLLVLFARAQSAPFLSDRFQLRRAHTPSVRTSRSLPLIHTQEIQCHWCRDHLTRARHLKKRFYTEPANPLFGL